MMICRLLNVAVDQQPEMLQASFAFPAGTLEVDLLLRIGPGRLMHAEYMRRASPDVVTRMLGYRWAIMRAHPAETVTQHVIVLGEGRIRGHDDRARNGFDLDLDVLYLREVDPARLLVDPSQATLAALGRGTTAERAEAFRSALQLIRREGGVRAAELIEFAAVLGTITLDSSIIGEIAQEVGMLAEIMAELRSELREQMWREEGAALREQVRREEGAALREQVRREEGAALREQVREGVLTDLLQERFGDRPQIPALARRLLSWPSSAAVHATLAAGSLEELDRAQPPA